jgi:DNA-binding NtrC family response regulator
MTPKIGRTTRILIIEDEPAVAFCLEQELVEAGFGIAGVAGRLNTALAMIEDLTFAAAILDANLAGVSARAAALALAARGLPYVVISGYSPEQLDLAFSGGQYLRKPCNVDQVVQVLNQLLAVDLTAGVAPTSI